jgi:hypothetical protein
VEPWQCWNLWDISKTSRRGLDAQKIDPSAGLHSPVCTQNTEQKKREREGQTHEDGAIVFFKIWSPCTSWIFINLHDTSYFIYIWWRNKLAARLNHVQRPQGASDVSEQLQVLKRGRGVIPWYPSVI